MVLVTTINLCHPYELPKGTPNHGLHTEYTNYPFNIIKKHSHTIHFNWCMNRLLMCRFTNLVRNPIKITYSIELAYWFADYVWVNEIVFHMWYLLHQISKIWLIPMSWVLNSEPLANGQRLLPQNLYPFCRMVISFIICC